VFLMLIFFLIAGTLAPPVPTGLQSVSSTTSPPSAPPDALAVTADGQLFNRSQATTLAAFIGSIQTGGAPTVRLLADQKLPAHDLMQLITDLRSLGASKVLLITERET